MKVKHDGHEHEFEPQFGLPEPLPADERMLWQGAPDWRMLARSAFHVRKLAVYFGVILALRVAFVVADGGAAAEAVKAIAMLLPLALLAIAIAATLAWLSSRTTVYTITDKRVVMRIGIVLSMTFNLPLKRLATAGLRLNADGTGDIPLALAGSDTIAYLHLWPHARPWRIAKTEPMLRCVPNAAEVSSLLADAWAQSNGMSALESMPAEPITRANPVSSAAGKDRGVGQGHGQGHGLGLGHGHCHPHAAGRPAHA